MPIHLRMYASVSQKVMLEGSQVQGCPCLYRKVKADLGYMRPCLRRKEKGKLSLFFFSEGDANLENKVFFKSSQSQN